MSPKSVTSLLVFAVFAVLAVSSPRISYEQAYENYTITANGTQFSIPYTMSGGKISSLSLDSLEKKVSIEIQSDAKGNITINLARALIDATENGDSSHFVVLVNGHGAGYREVISTNSRDITIQYPSGTSDIEIKGTQAIPEFGTTAVYIFMASTALVIFVYRRWSATLFS